MPRRILMALLALVLVVGGLTGCQSLLGGGKERVLRIDESDLGYPAFYTVSTRGRGFLLNSLMFDTLTWKDENGVIPLLAKTWRASDDNQSWEFDLVQNAKFSDGQPVTAADVKFTFDYVKAHPHPWVSLQMVDSVEVVDQYKVKIVLNQVYAPFITEVAGNVPILPQHIWQDVADPAQFNGPQAVIGSGPFTLEQYDVTAGSYVFVANKQYFLGAPQIDRLVMSQVSNPLQALQNGELDAAQKMKYGEYLQLQQDSKLKVIEGPGLWVYRLYFNFNRPELRQVALRQAFYYAINRQELVEKVTGGGGVPGNPGHIIPDSEWYSANVQQYDFSVEQAKRLLDDAGIVDKNGDGIREYQGKALKYELLAAEDRTKESELVKGYLAAIGVQITVKTMDQKSLDAMVSDGNFSIALNGHGSFGGDPVLLARFVSNNSQGATPGSTVQGGGVWGNQRFDQLFQAQMQELDQNTRLAEVAEMQQLIATELPTLTLYYTVSTFAWNPAALNGWFYTKDGVARAVPTVNNKLVYIRGTWGK